MECQACGAPDAPAKLWIDAWLGLTCVTVCRKRECAEEMCRQLDGKWRKPPKTREERAAEKLASAG